jgi:inner membrane protein
MPTALTHAVPALAMGALFISPRSPRTVWLAGVTLAVIPDLDVITFSLNVGSYGMLSHRGLSHSLFFAALASFLVFAAVTRAYPEVKSKTLWLYFFLCCAMHGVLDGLTNGGWGVAFFAPLDSARYFLPIQPVLVSPISLEGILTDYGKAVISNEIRWVWIPFIFLSIIGYAWRVRILTRPTMEKLPSNAATDLPTIASS